MLTEHEVFRIVDKNSRNTGVELEVNWNSQDENTNNCKVLRMTYDEKEYFIDKKILLELVWAIGTREEQHRLVPQTLETIHHYRTTLGIKAKKDIHKDEMINFPVELSIPCSALRQEVIDKLPKEYKKVVNGSLPIIKS